MARALHVRIPPNVIHDQRILAMETDMTSMKTDLASLASQVGGLASNIDDPWPCSTLKGGRTRLLGPPVSFAMPKTRPPAPLPSGSKKGTKSATWFEQFAAYAALLHLASDTWVGHASLCLTERTAEEWALIKESLALHGKDVKDFKVFQAELTANFVDVSV